MTANGLDGIAQSHNDGLLCLDELGQANGKEVGDIVYALANGTPKRRRTSSIAKSWMVLILSSGETTLAAHMDAAGKNVRPGQEVRLCDLVADAGGGLGLFENLHGFENPSGFARHLAEATRLHYGSPIRTFLRTLVEDKEKTRKHVIALRDQFFELHVPTGTSGELRRAASRFALVAAAGELATAAGVTGWREGESFDACGVCFESWLSGRGTTLADTTENVIRRVGRFLEAETTHGVGLGVRDQAQPLAVDSQLSVARVEKKGDACLVPPEVFRRDLCAGFDPEMVLRILREQGYLQHDPGRLEKSVRLPGAGTRRVYSIKASILDKLSGVSIDRGVNSGDSGNNGDAGSKSTQTPESQGDGCVTSGTGDSGGTLSAGAMIEDPAARWTGRAETEEVPSESTEPQIVVADGAPYPAKNTREA
jgi:putative DNA primase/helicase